MLFHPTPLQGAWLIEAEPHQDDRGWFARSFCEREFAAHGLQHRFVQHSRSFSKLAGTLRGLHFQSAPFEEEKLVSCVSGAIFDVIFDMRPESPSYRQAFSAELSDTNGRQLYIPKGVAHGFQALCDAVTVNYLISEFHAPEHAAGFRYDDPALGIEWPLPVTQISEKDLGWPPWEPSAIKKHLDA
jgi:dTDP-4-dehydrorhamnose 3,5-epimerase